LPKKNSSRKAILAIEYEPCIVTFIDVLGFQSLLNSRSAAEIHRIIKSLQHFTRPVDEGEINRSKSKTRLVSQAYAESVSDAIVRVRPYKTEYQDGALVYELLDLLHAQMELVNSGVLIRAGTTVGNAYVGPKGEGPIFGPGMVRAYRIESEEAIYPRILIDSHALEQHKLDKHLRSDNLPRYEFKVLRELLATGSDGERFIDYLGAAAGECDDAGSYFTFLQTHANLVRKGLKEAANARIERKYVWLRRYHNKNVKSLRALNTKTEKRKRIFFNEFEIQPEEFFEELLVAP
jgi:hypothetical protein